jgi:hypothetical protein
LGPVTSAAFMYLNPAATATAICRWSGSESPPDRQGFAFWRVKPLCGTADTAALYGLSARLPAAFHSEAFDQQSEPRRGRPTRIALGGGVAATKATDVPTIWPVPGGATGLPGDFPGSSGSVTYACVMRRKSPESFRSDSKNRVKASKLKAETDADRAGSMHLNNHRGGQREKVAAWAF